MSLLQVCKTSMAWYCFPRGAEVAVLFPEGIVWIGEHGKVDE